MRICIVTPAPPRSRTGNRITALRWKRILRSLGHDVTVAQELTRRKFDLLVALHARRSYPSIRQASRSTSSVPIVVALTGTDLYGDIKTNANAKRSLDLATRLVVLQERGVDELPTRLRSKASVIVQSVIPLANPPLPRRNTFDICVVGHLRPVKDPFRAAMAAKRLPSSSRIRIVHVGGAMTEGLRRRAEAETVKNPRYRWLGELPPGETRRVIAQSKLLVLSSRSEGGANVVCEALADRVPVISSHISGSIGLLGADHPGYYPFGDTAALLALMHKAEDDEHYYQILKKQGQRRRALVSPARERKAWSELIRKL